MTAEFVWDSAIAQKIEPLPYHRSTEDNYARLGRDYRLKGMLPPDDERMGELAEVVEQEGLAAQIGG